MRQNVDSLKFFFCFKIETSGISAKHQLLWYMARINSEDISRVWCVCTVYIHFGLLFYLPKWHFTTYHKTVDGHLCVGSFLLPPIFFLTFRKKKRNTFLKEFRAIFFYSLFSNSSFYFFIAPLFIPSFPEGFRSPLRDFFLKRFNSHLKKKTEIENSELVFLFFYSFISPALNSWN